MVLPVLVVDYDPHWPALFAALRERIVPVLGELVIAVEHVGSTSVLGLAAKPIIDMDVVVATAADVPGAIAGLAELGYPHLGDLGITGREAFRSPGHLPRHHLYLCAADADEYHRHLRFRDYLRTHPEARDAYAELKRSLAVEFRDDRDAYTEGKTGFIRNILKRCATRCTNPVP